jgi:predicted phage tail protein
VGATEPIRFVPVVAGAKRGGVLQVIIGIIILVAAYYGYGNQTTVQLGLSLVLGGVIQLLSPQRVGKSQSGDTLASYAFDGPVNTTEQGGPVPVAMGRVVCGSTVVSQGLSSVQIAVSADIPTLSGPELPPWNNGSGPWTGPHVILPE